MTKGLDAQASISDAASMDSRKEDPLFSGWFLCTFAIKVALIVAMSH